MQVIKKSTPYTALRTENNNTVPSSTIGKHPANDTLYEELEMRYGGAFAQWVIDDLSKNTTRARRVSHNSTAITA